MTYFVVERHLPGITPDALKAAGIRAKTCCAEMADEGTKVRWVRSFFVPAAEQTYCLFEAGTKDAVVEANRRAQIPFKAVNEALEMTPDAV